MSAPTLTVGAAAPTATVEQILIKAKEFLSDPKRWMKGYYGSQSLNCFCSVGITVETASNHGIRDWGRSGEPSTLLDEAAVRLDPTTEDQDLRPAAFYNDREETTHEQIMSLFDDAIADAKKRGL